VGENDPLGRGFHKEDVTFSAGWRSLDQRVVAAVGCGPLSAASAGASVWGCAVDGSFAAAWGGGLG
jgi:hypothetical protein